jgi:hypothetical protein
MATVKEDYRKVIKNMTDKVFKARIAKVKSKK